MTDKNEKRKQAAALSYESSEHSAPVLVAKGTGSTAEEIIELAKENDIPIQEDATLVQLLSELEINERIPEELYEAVAEIFSFIYRVEKEIS